VFLLCSSYIYLSRPQQALFVKLTFSFFRSAATAYLFVKTVKQIEKILNNTPTIRFRYFAGNWRTCPVTHYQFGG